MRRNAAILAVSILAGVFAIPAANAQGATCQNAQYNPDLLARFPKLPADCLDIITRDGQQYAVIKAQLTKTGPGQVYVRVKQPDGSLGKTQRINVKKNFKVQINGKATDVQDLALGQELTAYVKVSEPVVALAPAADSEPLQTTPIAAAPEPAKQGHVPKTASELPLYGLLGGGLLLLGTLIALLRIMMVRSLQPRRAE